MTYKEIDFIFPFVVFGYGLIMTFVLGHPVLMKLAESRLPSETFQSFKAKKFLGLVCLWVGGLWALQNLWLQ